MTLADWGNAYGNLRNAAKKNGLLERARRIEEAAFGPEHVVAVTTLANLSNVYGAPVSRGGAAMGSGGGQDVHSGSSACSPLSSI